MADIYVRALCGWHMSKPGHFVISDSTRAAGDEPALFISSPLRAEPGREGSFGGMGAHLRREDVVRFRDQLSDWLDAHPKVALKETRDE